MGIGTGEGCRGKIVLDFSLVPNGQWRIGGGGEESRNQKKVKIIDTI